MTKIGLYPIAEQSLVFTSSFLFPGSNWWPVGSPEPRAVKATPFFTFLSHSNIIRQMIIVTNRVPAV